MTTRFVCAAIVGGFCASSALADDPILQLDLNGLGIQALDSGGAAVGFGGLLHTGSIQLFYQPSVSSLASVSVSPGAGPFIDQGFNGELTSVLGSISLVNGLVTGGVISVQVNGGGPDPDSYTALVLAASGSVQPYIGGGFTVEGLTFAGAFDDSMFGNVDISPWLAGSLNGSFLQFNFSPNASGSGFADIDAFVVAPAPGTLAGLAAGGLVFARRRRR